MALASKFGGGAAQDKTGGDAAFLTASLEFMVGPTKSASAALAAAATIHRPDRAGAVSEYLSRHETVESGAPAPVSVRKPTTGAGF